MWWSNKKDNGINWQKEVFETSKAIPAILKELESIGKGFSDHVETGRKQRDEDKVGKKDSKDQLIAIDLKLAEAIKCPKSEQIDNIASDVKDLKDDKTLKKGKFMGMKLIHTIIIGVFAFVALTLGVVLTLKSLHII